MFERIKEKLIGILTSRVTVMVLIAFALAGILLYRLFQLQIVRGEEYLNNFILESRKTREIAAARGKILDRNGKVLAYNELAYSVKIEDVYETSRSKNKNLNANIRKLIKLIEKNGDSIIMDSAKVSASPQLTAADVDASLIHEAAIGKIAGEQLLKLMTLGLTEQEAEERIVSGFLK